MSSESSFMSDMYLPVALGTLLFSTLVIGVILFILRYHKAQQKFEHERDKHKQALLQTEIEIREQTLDHISRELHDNLGQIASLIKINLNLIAQEIDEAHRSKLSESIELLKRMIADIKSLSLSLNTDNVQRIGLIEAVSNDIFRVNKTGELRIELHSESGVPELTADTEIFLYRMCQEMINNTLKHAGASAATLTFQTNSNDLSLVFRDNGKGFEVEEVLQNGKPGSSGLINLSKRCRIIGADLSIKSSPGNGTHIQILLPLH